MKINPPGVPPHVVPSEGGRRVVPETGRVAEVRDPWAGGGRSQARSRGAPRPLDAGVLAAGPPVRPEAAVVPEGAPPAERPFAEGSESWPSEGPKNSATIAVRVSPSRC